MDINTYYVSIDGRKCSDKESTLECFREALSLPDYFSTNFDSLEECLNDLDWVGSSNICLIINYSEELMSKDEKNKQILLEILKDVEREFDGEVPALELFFSNPKKLL